MGGYSRFNHQRGIVTFLKMLFVFMLVLALAGCGETSVFEGIGDDGSLEARQTAAQWALDKGDCNTSVTLFNTLQLEDPNNIDRKLDLSAAYLCQSGFSVQGLLDVVGDFSQNKEGTKDNLFLKITKQVSTLIPDATVWKGNVCKSKFLLGEVTQATWPCASTGDLTKNGKDAGYILTIVNLADATLTIADALNTVAGIAVCTTNSTAASGCTLTTGDLLSVANSLLSAQRSVAVATGIGSDLSGTIENLVSNINNTSGNDGTATLTNSEVLNYFCLLYTSPSPRD